MTGGEFRGRYIEAPEGDHTRPTQSRLRQALFNSIQLVIPDATVLDLFAGSGALGFEALSRGAARAVFVEENRNVAKIIERNAAALKVQDRIEIIADALPKAWKRVKGEFEIIIADPPYADGWETKLLDEGPWGTCLTEGGVFVLEWGAQKSQVAELPDQVGCLVKTREKNYGDSVLTTFSKGG